MARYYKGWNIDGRHDPWRHHHGCGCVVMLALIIALATCAVAFGLDFETYNSPEVDVPRNFLCNVAVDVDLRCPPLERRSIQGRSRQFYVHEAVHKINNEYSNRKQCYGLYVGDGNIVSFKTQPKLTLYQVAAVVPLNERDELWTLFLVLPSTRQNQDKFPLYILNEATAYRLDAKHCRQEGLPLQGADKYFERYL